MYDGSGALFSRLCGIGLPPIHRYLNKMMIVLDFHVPAKTERLYGESLQAAFMITPNGRL